MYARAKIFLNLGFTIRIPGVRLASVFCLTWSTGGSNSTSPYARRWLNMFPKSQVSYFRGQTRSTRTPIRIMARPNSFRFFYLDAQMNYILGAQVSLDRSRLSIHRWRVHIRATLAEFARSRPYGEKPMRGRLTRHGLHLHAEPLLRR